MAQIPRRTVLALLFVVLVVSVAAQEVEPAWMRIARADRHAETRQYGIAILLYREALTLEPGNPEALFGLGRAFKSVNDYGEAEGYFKEAIRHSDSLAVPAMVYQINYELADLYMTRREFADYERVLTEIITMADGEPLPPRTARPESSKLRNTFFTGGLDRTLVLYRLPEDGGTRARGDFCEFLTGLGRYASATEVGLIAVQQRMSTVIEALIDRDPDFEFTSVRNALQTASVYPETRRYLESTLLFRDLYFLGSAVYADGRPELARQVWELVASTENRFTDRAQSQLVDPEPEPLLVPPR